MQEIGKKSAQIELPWRWFDRYTVKEKKRRKDNFGHLCRLPTNGFRFSKSSTIHWLKKSLPPQKNQSAREIQNWPTDYRPKKRKSFLGLPKLCYTLHNTVTTGRSTYQPFRSHRDSPKRPNTLFAFYRHTRWLYIHQQSSSSSSNCLNTTFRPGKSGLLWAGYTSKLSKQTSGCTVKNF